jgi:hypothetical protein
MEKVKIPKLPPVKAFKKIAVKKSLSHKGARGR